MGMKTLFPLLFVLPLVSAFASSGDLVSRAQKAYLDTDKTFDLDCYYSWNQNYKLIVPKGLTQKTSDKITREFMIEDGERSIPFNFTVYMDKGKPQYQALIDGIHTSMGPVARREFYIAPIQDKNTQTEWETNKIYCNVNFAYAQPYVLTDGEYHFSVHPQTVYDWQNRLKTQIEEYLTRPDLRSVIFLETGNYRGNLVNIQDFFSGKDYRLPITKFETSLTEVPSDVPLIVSPAGNNRFELQADKEIRITFTGGNHNYCIWNVARHVLEDLMVSKSNAKIFFRYDMGAIVAQTGGVVGNQMNFSRRDVNRSNLLRDLLQDPKKQKAYHTGYMNYFIDYLAREYKAMYRTYTVRYEAPGFSETVVLRGQGLRDLEASFTYFND